MWEFFMRPKTCLLAFPPKKTQKTQSFLKTFSQPVSIGRRKVCDGEIVESFSSGFFATPCKLREDGISCFLSTHFAISLSLRPRGGGRPVRRRRRRLFGRGTRKVHWLGSVGFWRGFRQGRLMLVKALEYFEHFGEFLPLWWLHLSSPSSTLKGTFSKEGDEEGAWKNSQLISFVRSRLALRRKGRG